MSDDRTMLGEATYIARAVAFCCAQDDAALPILVNRICSSVAFAKASLATQAALDAVLMLAMSPEAETEALRLLKS